MDDGLPSLLAETEVTTGLPIWRHPEGQPAEAEAMKPQFTTIPGRGRRQTAHECAQLRASGVVAPNHIGDLLTVHHHIPVASLTFPTTNCGVRRRTKKSVRIASRGKYGLPSTTTMSSLSARTVPLKIACILPVTTRMIVTQATAFKPGLQQSDGNTQRSRA